MPHRRPPSPARMPLTHGLQAQPSCAHPHTAYAQHCSSSSPQYASVRPVRVPRVVQVWDFERGKVRKDLSYQGQDEFMMHDEPVLALSFSHDAELLASGSQVRAPSSHPDGEICGDMRRYGEICGDACTCLRTPRPFGGQLRWRWPLGFSCTPVRSAAALACWTALARWKGSCTCGGCLRADSRPAACHRRRGTSRCGACARGSACADSTRRTPRV